MNFYGREHEKTSRQTVNKLLIDTFSKRERIEITPLHHKTPNIWSKVKNTL